MVITLAVVPVSEITRNTYLRLPASEMKQMICILGERRDVISLEREASRACCRGDPVTFMNVEEWGIFLVTVPMLRRTNVAAGVQNRPADEGEDARCGRTEHVHVKIATELQQSATAAARSALERLKPLAADSVAALILSAASYAPPFFSLPHMELADDGMVPLSKGLIAQESVVVYLMCNRVMSTFADMEGVETYVSSFLGQADEVMEERIAGYLFFRPNMLWLCRFDGSRI
ncbi:hypothetical protein Tco_0553929 [Tanacetum coccineum]